jgi:phosphatidyl-myo-inositol dimannoside synthase
MRALVLANDAYGGRGGIALYCRHLIQALCVLPSMERVVAIPKKIFYPMENLPPNLIYKVEASENNGRYIRACLTLPFSEPCFDVIVCGHLHLLPVARVLQLYYQCPVVPVVYGIDAWNPTPHVLVNHLATKLESFIAIRRLTAERLVAWAGLKSGNYHYLPNCIDERHYGIRPKRSDLIERYNLQGKTVIATAGRLDSHPNEHNKGFDEILDILAELKKRIPNIMYLIIGDGNDKDRLAQKARALDVGSHVVFTGYIAEHEKPDHYRLADVFAMPGSNPNFDRYPYRFVFLEALACGVPVVGCNLEDPLERNDPDASLIIQVDPKDKEDIIRGIQIALSRKEKRLQPAIEKFYFRAFQENLIKILNKLLAENCRHKFAAESE